MDRIPLSGIVSPIYPTDNYPVIDPRYGIDGLRGLDTKEEMYNLPLEKRRAGMVVGIPLTSSNNVEYYKLKPQGNGVTWSLGATSNWDGFLTSVTGSNAIPVKYNITNETITVPTNYEYLIWGNMAIGNSGSFINDGKTYIINGTISLSGDGTYSNNSSMLYYITTPNKYSETIEVSPNGFTVSHMLGTEDIVYTVRDNIAKNFITVNAEIIDANKILLKSTTTYSNTRVTIIG